MALGETLQGHEIAQGRIAGHLLAATKEIELPDVASYTTKVKEALALTPAIEAKVLLQTLLAQEVTLAPIGPYGKRPEGIIFSALIPDLQPRFLKLYFGSGLPEELTDSFVNKLYPNAPVPKKVLGVRMPFQPVIIEDEIYRNLTENDFGTGYYASAEVVTRAMAAVVTPDQMQLPTSFLNEEGEIMGFMLTHHALIIRAENTHRRYIVFDFSLGEGIILREDLPQPVRELINKLSAGNVYIYNQPINNIWGQMLVDAAGEFVTFARLGYVVAQRGDGQPQWTETPKKKD